MARNSLGRRGLLASVAVAGSLFAPGLARATVYWDGAGTTWNVAADWNTSATGSGGSAQIPGTGDIAVFSGSNVTTSQATTLGAAQSILGLLFQNAGYNVSVGPGTPPSNSLTIGLSGITMNSGAGASTITSTIILGGTQTWTNNASSLMTIGGAVSGGASSLTLAGTGNTSISGVIGGNANLNLNASSAATLSLGGNNTFTGQTVIQSGTVSIATVAPAGTSQPLGRNVNPVQVGTSTAYITTNATLAYTGSTASGALPITLGSGGGAIAVTNSASTLTITSAITGGPLTVQGPGTLAVSAPNSYSGRTNLTGGTMLVNATSTLGAGTVTLSGGATLHFAAAPGPAVTMPTASASYVCSSSWNNYSQNPASIGVGTPWQVGANGLGSPQPDFVFVSLGANYNLSQVTINWNEASVNPAQFAFYTAPASTPITNLYTSPLSTNNPTATLGGATSPNTLNLANWTLDSAQFTAAAPTAGNYTYALNGISGGYVALLVTQRGMNPYGMGIVQMSLNQAGSSPVTQPVSALSSADPTSQVMADAGVTLNVGTDSTNTTFAGTISGAGALTKVGTGKLTLSGASNYTGGTTLSSGLLVVANSSGSATGAGPVTLNGGQLASDPGIIAGIVLAGSGPHSISPGGDGLTRSLTVGGLTLNSNSTLRFDIANTTTLDQIIDLGAFNFSGPGAAALMVPNLLADGTYELITFNTTSTLSDTSDFSLGLIGGGTAPSSYTLALHGNALDLQVNAMPEPATWVLFGLGAAALLTRRQRAAS